MPGIDADRPDPDPDPQHWYLSKNSKCRLSSFGSRFTTLVRSYLVRRNSKWRLSSFGSRSTTLVYLYVGILNGDFLVYNILKQYRTNKNNKIIFWLNLTAVWYLILPTVLVYRYFSDIFLETLSIKS
jgi:hypothetical protein